VVHLVPSLFRLWDGLIGGAERFALELARHMADETSTELVSFGKNPYHEDQGSLKIRIINDAWFVRGQRTNPFSLSLLSELGKADVIHCHQQHVLSSSFAALVSRIAGKKVFVSDLGGGGWDISAYVSTDRWYHGHLHISEYSRKVFGHDNIQNAHVIYGGVDTEKFSPKVQKSEISGNTSDVRRKVLFVGRLLPHKGINYLIEGLPWDMTLEIIGQPYDETYARELKQICQGKSVTFRHDCDDEALVDAYRNAMCIVLPSVYRDMYGRQTEVPELLGQTLLEGMSCGIPAICTNVASMPEVVVDSVTGFIVPPNDPQALGEKLIWLRDHPCEAKRMGELARQRVLEFFTWSRVVRRCLEIYASG
jgi:glycosyltransferase involved in cell wall biosynthesis